VGAYSTPPDPLAGFERRFAAETAEKGRGRKGRGRGEKGKGGTPETVYSR